MQSITLGLRPTVAGRHGRRRLASFAELYRHSVSNAPVHPGDRIVGHVVGHRRARSSSRQRFYVVDFGMKTEAPFASGEMPGSSTIGSRVALPIIELEDAFNEPSLDYEQRSSLPELQMERVSLLTGMAPNRTHMIHGRFAVFKRGGASVKALGTDSFVPRHHIVAIERPILGSHAPFYVLSVAMAARGKGPAASSDVCPVLSSYGGYLFTLANLVGFDDQWKASGGGSARERIGYLRLLTRLLMFKNREVRRIMPRHNDTDANSYVGAGTRGYQMRVDSPSNTARNDRRRAWLNNMEPDLLRPWGNLWENGGVSTPFRQQNVRESGESSSPCKAPSE